MAGVKGKSGRKSKYAETDVGKILGMAKRYIIQNWDSFDDKTKIRLSESFINKAMPSKQEIESKSEVIHKEDVQQSIYEAVQKIRISEN